MSQTARTEYEKARNRQLNQNDARRILTRVTAAQENPARAGIRWPFELIQNAHDAGPHNNDSRVEIRFALQDKHLLVSHNGKPFTSQDLAALLSGGSNKEFDDEETTGRFGTGFLVTHALSTHVNIDGILETQEGYERFKIELDRDGDQDAIANNIRHADEAISNAQPLSKSDIDNGPTASFIYHGVDSVFVQRGLDRLEQVLPYLYATCDRLGHVRIECPHKITLFEPTATTETEIDDFIIKRTKVSISQSETIQRLALRIGRKNAQSGLIVVLEHNDSPHYRVILPDSKFPKIFVKFPIAGTDFLPFKVVLDGRFALGQERDGIAMNANDKTLVKEALHAFPAIIQYAVESSWQDAHELAHLAVPERPLSGESESGEVEWWEEIISEIAEGTAVKPIIDTEAGFFPALHGDRKNVSFLVPATDLKGQNPVDHDTIYKLASRVSDIQLLRKAIAQDWDQVALQWDEIGLPIARLGLTELTSWVKKNKNITDLPISGDPFKWLADLLLLASDLPEEINVRPIFEGFVPDQHSQLRHLNDLRIDDGIPEKIKNIANNIEIDLRSDLLHNNLVDALDEPGYEPAKKLIYELLNEPYRETEAIDKILNKLDKCLPDDSEFGEETDLYALRVSAHLVMYLVENDDNVQRLRKCPLLTADDTVVRLVRNLQILAPIPHWPSSVQSYKSLYAEKRILSNLYINNSEISESLQPLIEVNLVIPSPLYKAPRPLIDDENLLKTMTATNIETDGITVRNQPFGQIAFLATELVNRCGHDKELAILLLDFVLNIAANEDQSWSDTSVVNGNRSGEQVPLSLYQSIWPFELKVRSWVPVLIEDGETFVPGPANEANLRELLKPCWLQNNPLGIKLLHHVFGFRQLALMIENLEPEVEDNLVKLLQDTDLMKSTVANLDMVKTVVKHPEVVRLISEAGPDEVQKIREELDKQKQQAQLGERSRKFGYAVQEAVEKAIESHGLNLELVDRGYDYKVFPPEWDGSLEDVPFSFKAGNYFLEVKATTTRDVRLTPMQAKTACDYPDRFVLCVVDLCGEEIKEVWQAADVSSRAKIITDISNKVEKIYERVDAFSSSGNPVRLHNEQLLRYGVSTELWENGISIDEWVQSLSRTD